MEQYLQLVKKVIHQGYDKQDRTKTGVRSLFGEQMKFDLALGFPLITTKKVHFKSIVHELLWFLKGDTNIQYLKDHGVKIWDPWANDNGDLGRVYGAQWRSWHKPDGSTLDQIDQLITMIKEDPNSRRHIVVAYNPGELDQMALAPCHAMFQFFVAGDRLSCQLYQRSADVFLGVPFNIASYALLTMMICHITGLKYGKFIHTFGDVHLYQNHFHQAKLQLTRKPLKLCTVELNNQRKHIDDFCYDDIQLINYNHHPKIPAPISV